MKRTADDLDPLPKATKEITGKGDINNFGSGTVFCLNHGKTSMQTVRQESPVFDLSKKGFNPSSSANPESKIQTKRLKISEFKSWALFCGVIGLLTGALIYLKLGVTMETVTASIFFLSLGGLFYSIYQIIALVKQPATYDGNPVHGLN